MGCGGGGLHAKWWKARIDRQKEIDASIAAKADFEYLYDKPYEDRTIVRVAGPFTVESLSPHRVLTVGENDELVDPTAAARCEKGKSQDFTSMILDHLKTSGVQQAHGKIESSSHQSRLGRASSSALKVDTWKGPRKAGPRSARRSSSGRNSAR